MKSTKQSLVAPCLGGGRGVQYHQAGQCSPALVAVKGDFVVRNYHDDHQAGGRLEEGILLLHCSISLINHDSYIVYAHCFSIYLKNEITKTQVSFGFWPFAVVAQEISETMVTVEQMFRSFLDGSWD